MPVKRRVAADPGSDAVDAYLAARPLAVRRLLSQVREALCTALPGAEETISYKIPAYRIAGRTIIYFAGWKQHYSIYPATSAVLSKLGEELAPYAVSKGTIRFPFDRPVPVQLIARIAELRAREEFQARPQRKSKSTKTRAIRN